MFHSPSRPSHGIMGRMQHQHPTGARMVLGPMGGLVRGCHQHGCSRPWPCPTHGTMTSEGLSPKWTPSESDTKTSLLQALRQHDGCPCGVDFFAPEAPSVLSHKEGCAWAARFEAVRLEEERQITRAFWCDCGSRSFDAIPTSPGYKCFECGNYMGYGEAMQRQTGRLK